MTLQLCFKAVPLQSHLYDVPIIANDQLVPDLLYKKNQNLLYYFDNLMFVLALMLVQYISHYQFL